VTASQYSEQCFGDWVVELTGRKSFRLVRDRSQYMVGGDRASLEPAGLWRAFDDRDEFVRLVVRWAAV
jgi:hypothetical protein